MSDDIISKLLDAKTKTMLEEKSSEFGFVDSEDAIKFLVHNFISGKLILDFGKHYIVEELDAETDEEVFLVKQEMKKGSYITVDPEDPEDFKKLLQG